MSRMARDCTPSAHAVYCSLSFHAPAGFFVRSCCVWLLQKCTQAPALTQPPTLNQPPNLNQPPALTWRDQRHFVTLEGQEAEAQRGEQAAHLQNPAESKAARCSLSRRGLGSPSNRWRRGRQAGRQPRRLCFPTLHSPNVALCRPLPSLAWNKLALLSSHPAAAQGWHCRLATHCHAAMQPGNVHAHQNPLALTQQPRGRHTTASVDRRCACQLSHSSCSNLRGGGALRHSGATLLPSTPCPMVYLAPPPAVLWPLALTPCNHAFHQLVHHFPAPSPATQTPTPSPPCPPLTSRRPPAHQSRYGPTASVTQLSPPWCPAHPSSLPLTGHRPPARQSRTAPTVWAAHWSLMTRE